MIVGTYLLAGCAAFNSIAQISSQQPAASQHLCTAAQDIGDCRQLSGEAGEGGGPGDGGEGDAGGGGRGR